MQPNLSLPENILTMLSKRKKKQLHASYSLKTYELLVYLNQTMHSPEDGCRIFLRDARIYPEDQHRQDRIQ